MSLVVYLDETGGHSLINTDPAFPVFVLTMVICDQDDYINTIVPAFYGLKFKYWGHEGVILHSRDIRRWKNDFAFLSDPTVKSQFLGDLNTIMTTSSYKLIVTVIRKDRLKLQYGVWAHNPYNLALKYSLERLLPLLESVSQNAVWIIAEKRGKLEDGQLIAAFNRITSLGTEYQPAQRFSHIKFNLRFEPKDRNLIGHQMADLAGYPIGTSVLYPQRTNPAYQTLRPKIYQGPGWVYGLKIFP